MKALELDLKKVAFNKSGIKNYWWPISISDVDKIKKELFASMRRAIIEARQVSPIDARVVECIVLIAINNAISMIYASIMYSESESQNIQLYSTPSHKMLNMLLKNSSSKPEYFIGGLAASVVAPSTLRIWLRCIRDWFITLKTGIPRHSRTPFVNKNDIITLRDDSFVRAWMQLTNQKSKFVRTSQCFTYSNVIDKRMSSLELSLISILFNGVNSVFELNSIRFYDAHKKLLKGVIESAFVYARHYLKMLSSIDNIPKHLWINTGGSIWTRLLALAVRERGGEVMGFDHAGGAGFYSNLDDYLLKEFMICNRFVTFSEAQSNNFKKACLSHQACIPNRPIFINMVNKRKQGNNAEAFKKICSAMVLSPIYPIESFGTNALFLGSHQLLDFQIRLLAFLRQYLSSVILKLHPECLVRPPETLGEVLGVEVSTGLFEKEYNKADIIIFTSMCSTTFWKAVESDKRILLFDFDLVDLEPDVRELLKTRCHIISGEIIEGRAHVNWEEVENVLKSKEANHTNQFRDVFYVSNSSVIV